MLGDKAGEEESRGDASDSELEPNDIWSPSELRLNGLEMCFCGSRRHFPGHSVTPLPVFPFSQFPLCTLLSSEADLLSPDLNLDREKRSLELCPMLMLRTMRDFLAGLCRTCFNTTVFLSGQWGLTVAVSDFLLKVSGNLLSSTGKSVIMTPFRW